MLAFLYTYTNMAYISSIGDRDIATHMQILDTSVETDQSEAMQFCTCAPALMRS